MSKFSDAKRANRDLAAKLRSPDLADVRRALEEIRDASARAIVASMKSGPQKAHPHVQKALSKSRQELVRATVEAARAAAMRAKKLGQSGMRGMMKSHKHSLVITTKTPLIVPSSEDKRLVKIGHGLAAQSTRRIKSQIAAPIKRDKIEELARRIVGARNFERIASSPVKIADVIADRQMSRAIADTRRDIRTAAMAEFNETQIHEIRLANDVDPGWGKRWDAKRDMKVCRDCGALNGEIRAVDELFSCGLPGPPLHPNDRCSLTPVRL
jgi:hypothetical protein